MLDPWIIEEIRRREEEQRRRESDRRVIIEAPESDPNHEERGRPTDTEETSRGVVVIDFRVG